MTRSTIKLSRRQLKAVDRQTGALLVMDWPAGLTRGATPAIDEERDATAAEAAAIAALVEPVCRQHGLLLIDRSVGVFRGPPGRAPAQYLCAHVISPRWRDKSAGEPARLFVLADQ